jgi:hypothetical protein
VSAVRVYEAALALARRLEMGTDTDAFTQAATALLQVHYYHKEYIAYVAHSVMLS